MRRLTWKQTTLIIGVALSLQVSWIVVSLLTAGSEESQKSPVSSVATTTTSVVMSDPSTSTYVAPTTTTTPPVTTTWVPPQPADGTNVSACAGWTCDVVVSPGIEIPVNEPASAQSPAYVLEYRVARIDYQNGFITLHGLNRITGEPGFTVDLKPSQRTGVPEYYIEFVNFMTQNTAHIKVCPNNARTAAYGC